VIVHEATLENCWKDLAVSRGHSTPSMAAAFADHIRVSWDQGMGLLSC
jgi:ribonuclease BN (tRNA processing enzyme)